MKCDIHDSDIHLAIIGVLAGIGLPLNMHPTPAELSDGRLKRAVQCVAASIAYFHSGKAYSVATESEFLERALTVVSKTCKLDRYEISAAYRLI